MTTAAPIRFLTWYNARLKSHPYSTKATGTAATYFCADLTGQAIEGEKDVEAAKRVERAAKFAAMGGLWVGPLLTRWFFIMDNLIPGRTPVRIAAKVLVDQTIQGPLMIGSMFCISAAMNGAGPEAIYKKLEADLFGTWVSSVWVWTPVQVFQQAIVPMQYRVATANFVSYFWDTYLSLHMMPPPAAVGLPLDELPPTVAANAAPLLSPESRVIESTLIRRRSIVGPLM